MAKDLFSTQANWYAAFRPHYPPELYPILFNQTQAFDIAWDVGTGNGQVAKELSTRFAQVFASDVSEAQLAQAPVLEGVRYLIAPAEKTPIPDHMVQVTTVAQAIHWFDFPLFAKEVKRVSAPNAILAVWGYAFPELSHKLDLVFQSFYNSLPWDSRREWVNQHYRSLPLPFTLEQEHNFTMAFRWPVHSLFGYINSWSAFQALSPAQQEQQLKPIREQVNSLSKDVLLEVRFPLFYKQYRVKG